MTSSRSIALSVLMAAIHIATEADKVVPCLDRRRSHLWISDEPDEQEAAIHGCNSCPALVACSAYVEAHPEPCGVWAGRRPRRQREAPLIPEGQR